MESAKQTPAVVDASRLQQLEESALVEAIGDTFLPGLSLSDAVIFATLIVDVFQAANAETIFQNGIQQQTSVSNESEQVSTKPAQLSVPSSHEEGNSDYFHSFIILEKQETLVWCKIIVLNKYDKPTCPCKQAKSYYTNRSHTVSNYPRR